MGDIILYIFQEYSTVIIFFHVIGAVIWVGGMVAIRFGVHYALGSIDNINDKLGITLNILFNFFYLLLPAIIIVLFSAIIMIIGFDLKHSTNYHIALLKEGIYSFMVVIYLVAFYKIRRAKIFFASKDLHSAKKTLTPLSVYLVPANITLGTIAIFLGVILRGI